MKHSDLKEIPKESKDDVSNGKGKSEYYTGNKSKDLYVHIVQKDIEVDKPVKAKIYEQSVIWNKRQWPIIPERFMYDSKGIAHQYVDVNDMAVLTYHKDHTDVCKKCGGKMTVDARQSRTLGRQGIFQAVWGIDNTHMILMIVMMIGIMASIGAFFWAYNNYTIEKTRGENTIIQLSNANTRIAELEARLPSGGGVRVEG